MLDFLNKFTNGEPNIELILGNRYAYSSAGKRIGVAVFADEGSRITLNYIRSDIKGTGACSRLIEALKTYADKKKIPIIVEWMSNEIAPYLENRGFQVFPSDNRFDGYATYP